MSFKDKKINHKAKSISLHFVFLLFILTSCGIKTLKQTKSSSSEEVLQTNPETSSSGPTPFTVTLASAGDSFTCATKESIDSRASENYCWGKNNFLQLSSADAGSAQKSPFRLTELQSKTLSLSLGGAFGCALNPNDALKCWGRNDAFQLGNTSTQNQNPPGFVIDPNSEKIRLLSTGNDHNCVITESNIVQCWGRNNIGQLGLNIVPVHASNPNPIPVTIPANLPSDAQIMALKSSTNTNYILTADGLIGCWGSNNLGACGTGAVATSQSFVWSTLPAGVIAKQISPTGDSFCFLSQTNQVFCTGRNADGTLGDNTLTNRSSFVPATVLDGTNVRSIYADAKSGSTNCVITQTGGVRCFGRNGVGELGDNFVSGSVEYQPRDVVDSSMTPLNSVEQIISGFTNPATTNCALRSNGTVACWGSNSSGQLGINNIINSSVAVPVQLSGAAKSIFPGRVHICAIMTDDSVQCWGFVSNGRLGINASSGTLGYIPRPVQGLQSRVSSLALGLIHSCALLVNGLVKCWGGNSFGQLGDNDINLNRLTASTLLPYYGGLSNSTQVIAGNSHTCVLMGGGIPKCFGNNTSGQLGIGTTTNTSSPSYVNLPVLISQIALGENHSCFLGVDGLIYCTGSNSFGQLGNGSSSSQSLPTVISNLSRFTQIKSGKNHVCGINENGSVLCWGNNNIGQLGIGTTINQISPRLVTGLTEQIIGLAAGRSHTCALGKSKKVYCWGGNNFGQLGLSLNFDSFVPAEVTTLRSAKIKELIAGDNHTCAISENKSMYCWGANESGQIGINSLAQVSTPTLITQP